MNARRTVTTEITDAITCVAVARRYSVRRIRRDVAGFATLEADCSTQDGFRIRASRLRRWEAAIALSGFERGGVSWGTTRSLELEFSLKIKDCGCLPRVSRERVDDYSPRLRLRLFELAELTQSLTTTEIDELRESCAVLAAAKVGPGFKRRDTLVNRCLEAALCSLSRSAASQAIRAALLGDD